MAQGTWDLFKTFKSFNLNTAARSRRSKRSNAPLRSNRLQKQTVELRESGILETRDRHYLRWFPRAMHREVSSQVGRMRCRNLVTNPADFMDVRFIQELDKSGYIDSLYK